MFAYCNNNPVNFIDKNGNSMTNAMEWASTMWWLCCVDTVLPIGDIVYSVVLICFVCEAISITPISLPQQGTVSEVVDAPAVDAGKQGKHVPGHQNNDENKSQWNEGEDGVKQTQEAWQNGETVKPDGSVKIGQSSDGRTIKVHMDQRGHIHGYPIIRPIIHP